MAKKKFKKQVLRFGKWKHESAPGGVLHITKDWATKLVENFRHNPNVPIYRGHQPDSKAAENPDLIVAPNIEGLHLENDGVYAELRIDEKELEKYADVSASIEPDYEKKEGLGEKIGQTLRHIALVPSPYIKGLNPFMALGEDTSNLFVINLSDMDEKNKVAKPEEETKAPEGQEPEEEKGDPQKDENAPEPSAPADPESSEEPEGEEEEKEEEDGEAELAEKVKNLEIQLADMKAAKAASDAEAMYEKYLAAGKVLPSMKDTVIALASVTEQAIDLVDGSQKTVSIMLSELLEKMPVWINLEERGINFESGIQLNDIPDEEVHRRREIYFTDHPRASEDDFQAHLEDPAVKKIILRDIADRKKARK
jgi:hypothetical protein